MTKAFDPHYHTKLSDGYSSILESITSAKRKNLAALIITDHLNLNGYMNSYREGRTIMKMIRPGPEQGQFPAIIGTELSLPHSICKWQGHILVFGTEICETIQNNLSEFNQFDIQEFKKLKQKYEDTCAIVQCHPYKEATGIDQNLLPILDGCEITRGGKPHYNHESIKKDCEKHSITPLASSDGHVAYRDSRLVYEVERPLGKAYNIASIDLTCEKDLIRIIKENLIEKFVYSEEYRNF